MQNLKSENNRLIYYSVFAIICIPFVFYWMNLQELFSSSLSISITSIILTVCLIKIYDKVCDNSDLFILFFCISALCLNNVIYGNIGANLTLYNIVILLIVFNNVEFSKKQVQRIRFIMILLLLIFLLSLNLKPVYSTILVHDMRDNKINPNTLGMLVLAVYFQGFIFIDEFIKSKFLKFIFYITITYFSMKYIYLSESRTSLISASLFIILYLIKIVNLKNYKRMLSYMILAVLIIPFLYQIIIMSVGNIEIMGKSIFTRSLVWDSTINLIKTHPLIGCGTKADILMNPGEYTSSAHNVFLGVWKTIGIVPMITLMIYLLRGSNIKYVSPENYLSKKAFLCCMFVCAFETMLNDSNTYLFFITLLMTIKESETEKRQ